MRLLLDYVSAGSVKRRLGFVCFFFALIQASMVVVVVVLRLLLLAKGKSGSEIGYARLDRLLAHEE